MSSGVSWSPRVSIIVAVRNGAATIERCVDSVCRQSTSELELVVIDGGSTDGTVDVLHRYSQCIRYWESAADRGVAHAWNKGVERARGDWMLFLGADDYLWGLDVVEKMLPLLDHAGQRTAVIYGNVVAVDVMGRSLRVLSSPWNRRKFVRYGIYFSHQGVFHHRRLFAEHGEFDENFRYGPDYEMLLRYLVNHDAEYVDSVTVAGMQMGGMSNHPSQAFDALGDLRKARRKLGIRGDALLYYRALLGARAKKWLFSGRG